MSPSSSAEILLFALRRLKNSFFWFAVVPIFTSDHERRMYSWIDAFHRLHQADVAFRDHLGDRQAVAAIAHRDFRDEPQMAGDEPVCRIAIAMLAPALGQHVLFLRFQHREPADFLEIAREA